MKEYKPELKPPRLRGERKNTMVDIDKLIAWLDASSHTSCCLYEDYKAQGKELEAMRSITEMCCKQTFRDLLTNDAFLDKMYHIYFPEQETDAD